jgi:hypothetical protein
MKIKMILFAAFSMASAALYAQNGNVGIGTAAPSAKLHVNGNMKLADAPQAGAAAVSTLVRDNATGEIKVAATAANSFPMSLVTFQLSSAM